MIRTMAVLGLLFTGFFQHKGTDVLVIPTRIEVSPVAFGKGKPATIKASFKQPQVACPAAWKNRADGFSIRIYDEKDVPTEPTWTVQQSKSTKFIAYTNATVAPVAADDNKKVTRDFEAVQLPVNAPNRIYLVVWRACSGELLVDPFAHPPIYSPQLSAKSAGGQFYKYTCPGKGPIPTGKCGYYPE